MNHSQMDPSEILPFSIQWTRVLSLKTEDMEYRRQALALFNGSLRITQVLPPFLGEPIPELVFTSLADLQSHEYLACALADLLGQSPLYVAPDFGRKSVLHIADSDLWLVVEDDLYLRDGTAIFYLVKSNWIDQYVPLESSKIIWGCLEAIAEFK
jgi:hypothetical protein